MPASRSNVSSGSEFESSVGYSRAVRDIHAQVFGDIRPAATMVEVSALIAPELFVEIEADAYVES